MGGGQVPQPRLVVESRRVKRIAMVVRIRYDGRVNALLVLPEGEKTFVGFSAAPTRSSALASEGVPQLEGE